MTTANVTETKLQIDAGSILDAMQDAVIASNRDNRVLYANAAAERLLGYASGEMIGLPIVSFVPPRLQELHLASFERYFATGESRIIGRNLRLPALRADGSEIDVELNLSAFGEGDAEPLVIASLRDLSERVELERQITITRHLRASAVAASRLVSLLDIDDVLETVVTTLVKDFDAALARVWLYEPETDTLVLRASDGLSREVANSSRARIHLPTYPYKVGVVARTRMPVVKNDLQGDPDFEADWVEREHIASVAAYPLLAKNELLGVMVYFSRSPIPDEVSEVMANFAAIVTTSINDARSLERERTARAEAEEARRHTAFLAAIVESTDDAVLSKGLDGIIQSWNPAAERLYGYRAEEVIGKSVRVIIPPDRGDELVDIMARLSRGEGIDHHETVRVANDGRTIDIAATISPIFDAEGRVVGASTIARDITERKEAENAIASLNERLKLAVQETHHRVKNNLQLIAANVDLRANDGTGNVSSNELKQLGAYIQTLAIVHEFLMLDPSAVDDEGSVPFSAIFGRLLTMFQQTAGDRAIRCQVADVELPAKSATSLAIVVNELVSNAIKHGRGTIAVEFRLKGSKASLEVMDEGPGFPAGFESGLKASTGLQLVEGLLRHDLRGTISYANREPSGACVTVTIPHCG